MALPPPAEMMMYLGKRDKREKEDKNDTRNKRDTRDKRDKSDKRDTRNKRDTRDKRGDCLISNYPSTFHPDVPEIAERANEVLSFFSRSHPPTHVHVHLQRMYMYMYMYMYIYNSERVNNVLRVSSLFHPST